MAQAASPSLDAMFQDAVRRHRGGERAQARTLYEAVIAARPDHWDAIQLLGVLAAQEGEAARAAALFAQAIAINPGQPVLHNNLARIEAERGRHAEALASAERAVALQPDGVGARLIQAKMLSRLGRPADALAAYEAALARAPNDPDLNLHTALALLKLGRLEEGFARFEHRFASAGARRRPDYPQPLWRGDRDLAGQTLFIPYEFYPGDLIQMARFAPLAEAAGARVILAAPRRLHRLLGAIGRGVVLADEAETPAAFDLYCPLMSLPHAFGTTLDTVPAAVPYLEAEPPLERRWGDVIGTTGFKIGVCWQGSTRPYEHSMQRSFPLAALEGLSQAPGVRLISLQKFDGVEQLADAPAGLRIETLAEPFDEGAGAFVDTAAILASLDLVITCDTATAHLAGALGRPVWVALPYDADWRWLEGREDCPWYPSMRLFRQAAPGDWASVFAIMEAALAAR